MAKRGNSQNRDRENQPPPSEMGAQFYFSLDDQLSDSLDDLYDKYEKTYKKMEKIAKKNLKKTNKTHDQLMDLHQETMDSYVEYGDQMKETFKEESRFTEKSSGLFTGFFDLLGSLFHFLFVGPFITFSDWLWGLFDLVSAWKTPFLNMFGSVFSGIKNIAYSVIDGITSYFGVFVAMTLSQLDYIQSIFGTLIEPMIVHIMRPLEVFVAKFSFFIHRLLYPLAQYVAQAAKALTDFLESLMNAANGAGEAGSMVGYLATEVRDLVSGIVQIIRVIAKLGGPLLQGVWSILAFNLKVVAVAATAVLHVLNGIINTVTIVAKAFKDLYDSSTIVRVVFDSISTVLSVVGSIIGVLVLRLPILALLVLSVVRVIGGFVYTLMFGLVPALMAARLMFAKVMFAIEAFGPMMQILTGVLTGSWSKVSKGLTGLSTAFSTLAARLRSVFSEFSFLGTALTLFKTYVLGPLMPAIDKFIAVFVNVINTLFKTKLSVEGVKNSVDVLVKDLLSADAYLADFAAYLLKGAEAAGNMAAKNQTAAASVKFLARSALEAATDLAASMAKVTVSLGGLLVSFSMLGYSVRDLQRAWDEGDWTGVAMQIGLIAMQSAALVASLKALQISQSATALSTHAVTLATALWNLALSVSNGLVASVGLGVVAFGMAASKAIAPLFGLTAATTTFGAAIWATGIGALIGLLGMLAYWLYASEDATNALRAAFSKIAEVIRTAVEWLREMLSLLTDSVSGVLKWLGLGSVDAPGALPAAAEGGLIKRTGTVLVGEAGPELVTLPHGAVISPMSPARPTMTPANLAPLPASGASDSAAARGIGDAGGILKLLERIVRNQEEALSQRDRVVDLDYGDTGMLSLGVL